MTTKKKGGFWKGIKSELKKISWPTKSETITYSGVVILITIASALLIWVVDLVLRSGLDLFL